MLLLQLLLVSFDFVAALDVGFLLAAFEFMPMRSGDCFVVQSICVLNSNRAVSSLTMPNTQLRVQKASFVAECVWLRSVTIREPRIDTA